MSGHEVANIPEGFTEFRSMPEIASFASQFRSVVTEIGNRSRDPEIAWNVARPELTGAESYRPNPYYNDYEYVLFHRDIDGLVHFLNELDSNARPEMFPRIMEEVVEICDILAVVRESDSRTDVRELLNGWAGGAAAIFRGILADLQGAVREQAVVADQIGAAAVAYRSIAERAQADSMAIAYDVADRMVPSGGGWRQMGGQYLEALGQMLVVGLAIKDIAGSKGMSLLDSFSSWSKDQGEDMQEDARRRHLESYSLRDAANTNAGTSESREVVGEQAADFIGSAREQIQKVREHAWAADLIVHDALRRDVDEIDADPKLLEVAEADDIDHVDDLGEREQDVYLEDIVHLKKAGEADMRADVARGASAAGRDSGALRPGDR